jgi:two-component system, chemotaxis family, response regulator Rcp1
VLCYDPSKAFPLSLRKILVVEDNQADTLIIRTMLVEILGEHQFDVLTDGQEALKFVADHRSRVLRPEPCVIVIDLHLPKHNGLEVLEAVRMAPALDNIRVIMISSVATPKEVQRIQELSAFYRQKPFGLPEFQELAEFIAQVCRDQITVA